MLTAVGGADGTAPVWLARALRRRTAAQPRLASLTPLVGRETELSFLKALFDKAAGSSSPQVALIVGEPGIGKSRLVAELFGQVQSRDDAVIWRQGRCLPYGEGVSFWALGEVFKAHAGILETDDLVTVRGQARRHRAGGAGSRVAAQPLVRVARPRGAAGEP